MDKKTRILKLRLTPRQFDHVKKRSIPFGSMSHLVVKALEEFSDATAKERLELSRSLAEKYASLDANLAHVGANLNQAMHRINERAVANTDYYPILINELLPSVIQCYDLLKFIREDLRDTTLHVLK